MNELNRRLDNGELIFVAASRQTCFIPGIVTDDIEKGFNLFYKQSPESFKKLLDNYNKIYGESINPILKENINFSNLTNTQRLKLALINKSGLIDETSINVIKEIRKNPNAFQSIDFRMLDKNIIADFGEEFVIKNSRFNSFTNKLFVLKNTNQDLYKSYVNMVNNAMLDNSLNTVEIKNVLILNYLYDNINNLDNIKNINLDELQEYILMKSINSKIDIDFSNNFRQNYANQLDSFVLSLDSSLPESLENLKDAYFKKFYSMSLESAKELYYKYSTNIDYLVNSNEYNKSATLIKKIKDISNVSDYDTLYSLYRNQNFRLTAEEILHIDNNLREGYANSYIKAFSDTNKNINSQSFEYVKYENKDVKVISLNDDFSLAVYSSDTSFSSLKKTLINDSYVDTFVNIKMVKPMQYLHQ